MRVLRDMLAFHIRTETNKHYSFKRDYFIIEDWAKHSLTSRLTREHIPCYKVLYIATGRGVLVAGMRKYSLSDGDVVFLRPDEIMGWKMMSDTIEGHFCFIHPAFFKHARHVLRMLLAFPHLQPSKALVTLNKIESDLVHQSFRSMHQEAGSNFDDKKQAILIHFQMMLLRVRRAGKEHNITIPTIEN